MVISHLFLFVAFIIDLGEGQNVCAKSRCGSNGPDIQFPFRVNSQPDDCGHLGFNLSCTENQTVLELPISVKLFVKEIDYMSQEIHLSDPDKCFPRHLRQLNLSSSSFQLSEDHHLSDYALFNCSQEMDYYRISCLSSDPEYPNYHVYSVEYDRGIANVSISCKKMYNLLSIPDPIIFSGNILKLKWSRAVLCRQCQLKGMKCRIKKNKSTDCFPKDKGIVLCPISMPLHSIFSEFSSQHYALIAPQQSRIYCIHFHTNKIK
jgi:hypothetical protein